MKLAFLTTNYKYMTRGTTILITNNSMIETTEFNGDMYLEPNSNGQQMLDLLKKVKTEKDFKQAIKKFNQDNFGYKEKLFHTSRNENSITFTEQSYFKRWFSDYLFFLNISHKQIKFIDIEGKSKILKPNQIIIFYFGVYYKLTQQTIGQRSKIANT